MGSAISTNGRGERFSVVPLPPRHLDRRQEQQATDAAYVERQRSLYLCFFLLAVLNVLFWGAVRSRLQVLNAGERVGECVLVLLLVTHAGLLGFLALYLYRASRGVGWKGISACATGFILFVAPGPGFLILALTDHRIYKEIKAAKKAAAASAPVPPPL